VPPFKVTDLHELKTNESLRDRLRKNHPFNVMHDKSVKKQLFLLFEVFNKFKKRQEIIVGNTNLHDEKQQDASFAKEHERKEGGGTNSEN
jgi:hypothetical protein